MVNARYEDDFATFYGLAADEKPVGDDIANGSVFIEIDTGKAYFYDAENKTWREV